MSKDVKFITALDNLFSQNNITHIFESGTYNGTGSTTSLANAIEKSGKKVTQFITVEINRQTYADARRNLQRYPFITPVWGLTVGFEQARKFIREDEVINNHAQYPDIFIDGIDNPAKFYLKEIDGHCADKTILGKIKALFTGKSNIGVEETLFNKYLVPMAGNTPLILLDSAGGMGYLEFILVLQIMHGKDFFIILDDIHHLKHFRSYARIKEDKHFTMLDDSYGQGWAIAKYCGKVG